MGGAPLLHPLCRLGRTIPCLAARAELAVLQREEQSCPGCSRSKPPGSVPCLGLLCAGHKNIVEVKGSYEDKHSVHIVMELCTGGELFDRIIQRGHYSERQAASLLRTIVSVVEYCHAHGVMHRDLKPENFLLADKSEDAVLKTTDFGLSVFFKPGVRTSTFEAGTQALHAKAVLDGQPLRSALLRA